MKELLWNEFVFSHRGYSSLSRQFKLSVPTIQKYLDSFRPTVKSSKNHKRKLPKSAVIIVDTVYLSGRSFGVMIARNANTGKTLDRIYIISETINHFVTLVEKVRAVGIVIRAIVVDGRPGMLKAYSSIPTQMCQFHQIQIVTRYVTTRPKLIAGKQLRRIVLLLTTVKKDMFLKLLLKWHEKWGELLKEKTINKETGRWEYTHRRLRSAYYSLKTNLPYLFTYQEQQNSHLNIPNTTNSLDGSFAHLKDSLRVHRGLKRSRKIRLIESLIWR